ncbi:ATP-grasp fold amidoligase family protein [Ascidiimonas sp. W6]|uniref:ATP-grasp fold amidoligase family protein n=1 Tax=Ascidiimonas meishanensis TaxID=3128903 RepID=UPI0030EF07E8
MKFLPPEFYVKIYYEYYTGKKLNLKEPQEFNEKIQWLKVYYKPKILNTLVDKYAVKAYVEEKIGAQYLNETIAVYDKAGDVNFDELPDQFVIKGVHGCHFNLIVNDKSKMNALKSRFKLLKWMNKNQYYRGGLEWAYKDVKPRLLAEKYLSEMGKEAISDYKFYCFNGEPTFLQIDLERGNEANQRCYYDMNWKKTNFNKGKVKLYEGELERPENFDEMVSITKKLAGKFPFVRVDLYNINGKVLFGEMTFYPGDGRIDFTPDQYNKIIGDMITLPKIEKGKKIITKAF